MISEILQWENAMFIFIILFIACYLLDNYTRENIGWYDDDEEE
jgi:hypothetical protein